MNFRDDDIFIIKLIIVTSCVAILMMLIMYSTILIACEINNNDKIKDAIANNENITCKEYLKQMKESRYE